MLVRSFSCSFKLFSCCDPAWICGDLQIELGDLNIWICGDPHFSTDCSENDLWLAMKLADTELNIKA